MNFPRTRKQIILYKRLVGYCKQLGVTPVPLIAWSMKEVREVNPKEKDRSSRRSLGTCFYAMPLIYINYNGHKGLRALDDTLRHELIHYRFTGVQHGINFEKKMVELRQGKTWKAFDRLAWATAFNLKWELKKSERNFCNFINHLVKPNKCNCWDCWKARGYHYD